MATKRRKVRKTRRRSCKNGKLKKPVRTKSGRKRKCKKRKRRKKYKMERSKTMSRGPTTVRYGRYKRDPNLRLKRDKEERPDIYLTEEEEARWTSRMIANVLRERKEMEERQAQQNNEE